VRSGRLSPSRVRAWEFPRIRGLHPKSGVHVPPSLGSSSRSLKASKPRKLAASWKMIVGVGGVGTVSRSGAGEGVGAREVRRFRDSEIQRFGDEERPSSNREERNVWRWLGMSLSACGMLCCYSQRPAVLLFSAPACEESECDTTMTFAALRAEPQRAHTRTHTHTHTHILTHTESLPAPVATGVRRVEHG
jgi:hypothetical protein